MRQITASGSYSASPLVCRRVGSFIQVNGEFATLSSDMTGWPVLGLMLPVACRPSNDVWYFPAACWTSSAVNVACFGRFYTDGNVAIFASSAFRHVAFTGVYPAE
jgi:hypothetical protein